MKRYILPRRAATKQPMGIWDPHRLFCFFVGECDLFTLCKYIDTGVFLCYNIHKRTKIGK